MTLSKPPDAYRAEVAARIRRMLLASHNEPSPLLRAMARHTANKARAVLRGFDWNAYIKDTHHAEF